jgi:calcium-independent phospholipase A2-gamma
MRLLHNTSSYRTSVHRKPFVMATLYMLHIETSVLDVSKMVAIDRIRREHLKRFSKWVKCLCDAQCGREWNFVNEVGLSRERGDGRGECELVKLFDVKNSWKLMFKSEKVRRLEATRRVWEAVV